MRSFRPSCWVLLSLFLPLLAGCLGRGGIPLSPTELNDLQAYLEELDRASETEVKDRQAVFEERIREREGSKERAERSKLARDQVLLGYCWERRGESDRGALDEARREYAKAVSSEYGSVALFRTAQISEYLAQEAEARSRSVELTAAERQAAEADFEREKKSAIKSLERAAYFPMGAKVLVRHPAVGHHPLEFWEKADIRHKAYARLDKYFRDSTSYRVLEQLVRISGGEDRNSSYVLAIVLIAVIAKIVTTPLSAAQFRSMRAMQALQPELKKVQEKYKDDKAAMGKAQMELFREHKVNPASSCLPMLVQMPILIWVYYAIRHFTYNFIGVHFLHIKSLADPDLMQIGSASVPGPLILLYGASMYFSQKLISPPPTSKEQEQQQRMMSLMMPVLLVVMFSGLPSAFILYWFLQNLLMTGHQYLITRAHPAKPVNSEAGVGAPPPAAAGPPPEAMAKLSQGRGRSRKKKKKRRG